MASASSAVWVVCEASRDRSIKATVDAAVIRGRSIAHEHVQRAQMKAEKGGWGTKEEKKAGMRENKLAREAAVLYVAKMQYEDELAPGTKLH